MMEICLPIYVLFCDSALYRACWKRWS